MSIKSINPYTLDVIETFELFDDRKVQQCLARAGRAFADWRNRDFAHRATLMRKMGSLLSARKSALAASITAEMGKPIRESVSEIEKCAWTCEYFATHAADFLKDELVETDAGKSYFTYQPLGAVLAIMPWNFPFWQVLRFAAPSLMAGNVALLKHASNVSRCAILIQQLFEEAGFPEGVFQTLIIHSETVNKLIEDPAVKAVTLTGSEKAGMSVASTAGKNIKKSVLELGGSNAFIVLDDADLEKAADIGVKARMINNGQSCIAAKRFIVQDSIAEEYVMRFKEKMAALRVGDPRDSATEAGPLARVDLAEELENQVNRSIEKGAVLLLGGTRKDAFYPPTILTNVKPGMPAFDEELFGPVAAFTVVRSDDEAIALTNQSSFGLGASLFTTNLERARPFIEQIEDGSVFVNDLVKSDPRLPFGGTKRSGYGRELSAPGIREFVNIKTVYIRDL